MSKVSGSTPLSSERLSNPSPTALSASAWSGLKNPSSPAGSCSACFASSSSPESHNNIAWLKRQETESDDADAHWPMLYETLLSPWPSNLVIRGKLKYGNGSSPHGNESLYFVIVCQSVAEQKFKAPELGVVAEHGLEVVAQVQIICKILEDILATHVFHPIVANCSIRLHILLHARRRVQYHGSAIIWSCMEQFDSTLASPSLAVAMKVRPPDVKTLMLSGWKAPRMSYPWNMLICGLAASVKRHSLVPYANLHAASYPAILVG